MGLRSFARHALSRLGMALVAAFLFLPPAALPAGAADGPYLELDTAGHMALIRSLVFTRDGRELISASDDKTIRVWDVETGRLVRTIRGEIGDGDPGKIYAVALSRDGRLLAAAGALGDGAPIRLYDFRAGTLIGLLKGHKEAVLSLDFSPDGEHLVSSGVDDTAIVWDLRSRAPTSTLAGHKGDVNAARFTHDGSAIVTASDDDTLKLWRASDGALLDTLPGHTDKVVALAVSLRDGAIASGALDGTIKLWDLRERRVVKEIAQGTEVMSLAFSPDGTLLLSGVGRAPYQSHVYDVATGKEIAAYGGHDNIVLATAIAPDGMLAATAGGDNNEIHLWSLRDGKPVRALAGVGRPVWSVGFSPDGHFIAWGVAKPEGGGVAQAGPLDFTLKLPTADSPTGAPKPLRTGAEKFARAVTAAGGFELQTRASGDFGYLDLLDVVKDGEIAATIKRGEKAGYAHNAYSFTPDGKTVISGGGHGFLTAYDLDGNKLGEFVGHTSDVWAVAVSPDGRWLISGSDDQTLRLWNMRTRENVAALFHGRNGEWVLWTPQGYYAASPSGDAHVGWHVNEGEAAPARFVSAGQLKRHFYRPDIVTRALILGSSARGVQEAKGTELALSDLLQRKPPQFSVLSPPDGSAAEAETANIVLAVPQAVDAIEGFDITVNGLRVASRALGVPSEGDRSGERTFSVPLFGGENQIEIKAYNAIGQTTEVLRLNRAGVSTLDKRGTLYVVAIGVDDYPNFGQDLKFAGADARAFQEMLVLKAGPLHANVKSVVLAKGGDAAPTAAKIKSALDTLAGAGPNDTIVLFLAGHGVNEGPDYLFLPTDAKANGKIFDKSTVIEWEALQTAIETSKGRRIMLVDTCHSGNAFNPRLIKDAADASIAVYAATDAETLAQERPKLGHGVFTYAVIEGLKGGADFSKDKWVEAQELSTYVLATVRKLTEDRQQPTFSEAGGKDFIISTVKGAAK